MSVGLSASSLWKTVRQRPTVLGAGFTSATQRSDIWERDSKVREAVRPTSSDWTECAQFLADKGLKLHPASLDMFLDFLTRDFFAALALLARRARGDYGKDKWAEQFPRHEAIADASPSLSPWTLFERVVFWKLWHLSFVFVDWRKPFRPVLRTRRGEYAGRCQVDYQPGHSACRSCALTASAIR
jgi:hypothetical protein